MHDFNVLGLKTDPMIKKYLKSRGIPARKHRINNCGKVKDPIFDKDDEVRPMKNITHKKLYELAREADIHKLQTDKPNLIVYGSSSFHHITHSIHKEFTEPNLEKLVKGDKLSYSVLLIDNHSDTDSPSKWHGKKYTYCGGHIFDSIKSTETAGRSGHFVHVKKNNNRIEAYSENTFHDTHDIAELARHVENHHLIEKAEYYEERDAWRENNFSDYPQFLPLLNSFLMPDVYVTVDIDALSPDFVDIDQYESYKQGEMHLDDMLAILKSVKDNKNIIGMDICGMTEDERSFDVYDKILETMK